MLTIVCIIVIIIIIFVSSVFKMSNLLFICLSFYSHTTPHPGSIHNEELRLRNLEQIKNSNATHRFETKISMNQLSNIERFTVYKGRVVGWMGRVHLVCRSQLIDRSVGRSVILRSIRPRVGQRVEIGLPMAFLMTLCRSLNISAWHVEKFNGMASNTIQHNTIQYISTLRSTVQYNTCSCPIQCDIFTTQHTHTVPHTP